MTIFQSLKPQKCLNSNFYRAPLTSKGHTPPDRRSPPRSLSRDKKMPVFSLGSEIDLGHLVLQFSFFFGCACVRAHWSTLERRVWKSVPVHAPMWRRIRNKNSKKVFVQHVILLQARLKKAALLPNKPWTEPSRKNAELHQCLETIKWP